MPAITEAGLTPYRVDEDRSADIPIEQIEKGIRESAVCLADITTDNPNVWYELGFALAAGKPVCIVCSDERDGKYPFDIQHRRIIQYSTESKGDFQKLEEEIAQGLHALREKAEALAVNVESEEAVKARDLAKRDIETLRYILANQVVSPEVSGWQLQRDIEKSDMDESDLGLAVAALLSAGVIEQSISSDMGDEPSSVYAVTEKGFTWIDQNKELFPPRPRQGRTIRIADPLPEDDIPF